MAVRPARFARDPERQKAGAPPRLNTSPWPHLELGRELRQVLAEDGRKEQGARTLRRRSAPR